MSHLLNTEKPEREFRAEIHHQNGHKTIVNLPLLSTKNRWDRLAEIEILKPTIKHIQDQCKGAEVFIYSGSKII